MQFCHGLCVREIWKKWNQNHKFRKRKYKTNIFVDISIFLPIFSFTEDKEEYHSAANDFEQFGGVIFLHVAKENKEQKNAHFK